MNDREIQEALVIKVGALRQLASRFGMIGKFQRPPYPARLNRVTIDMVSLIVKHMTANGKFPAQRAACATLLDYYAPGWRDDAPLEILGFVIDRNHALVRKWRAAVLANDNHQCRTCGSREQLHAHHLIPWAESPPLRIEPTNGVTLCAACHIDVHREQKWPRRA